MIKFGIYPTKWFADPIYTSLTFPIRMDRHLIKWTKIQKHENNHMKKIESKTVLFLCMIVLLKVLNNLCRIIVYSL